MFVVEWRAIRSGLSGGLIRLAGFFVIFALLGMFIQMVTVAYPILASSSLTPAAPSAVFDASSPRLPSATKDAASPPNTSRPNKGFVFTAPGGWELQGDSGTPWFWVHELTGLRIENTALPTDWVKATMVGRSRGLVLLSEKGGVSHHYYIGPKLEGEAPSTQLVEQRTLNTRVVLLEGHPRLSVVAIATSLNTIEILDFRNPETLLTQDVGFAPTALSWESAGRVVAVGTEESRVFDFKATDIGGAWNRLIAPVHYEGYEEPDYVWLPLPASEEAEPKYSLAPLLFGTFKGAVLALIFAVPLSMGAAIYVGFFMSETQRRRVRPAIELLTAFPTVVLGAIGLFWIAPHFEYFLAGLIGVVSVFPLLATLAFVLLRGGGVRIVRLDALDDWPLKFLPMVLFILIASAWCGVSVASHLPGGSLGSFLATQGITLSYFNALLVGLILALAITPTIFSVAEEAIHSVPQNLSSGALALGSTPWQSYRDIVLPLAMPGMIAAVMIGFGRAAGETMIFLMLSGNSGVIDSNIFEGLRSVSASLALELPEAPRNSSHYHVLFVMGLLLFACTFAINTAAELIKDRVKARARGV
jgi:phosphate transport system permease protein